MKAWLYLNIGQHHLGFLVFRILDGLGRQHVPVGAQVTLLHLLVVDQDFVGVVRGDDERVQVGVLVVLS